MSAPTINQKVLGFVKGSDELLKEAEQLVAAVEATGAKVAEATPAICELLIQDGTIRKDEIKEATAKLGTHEGALDVLSFVLQKKAETTRSYEQKIAAAGNGKSIEVAAPSVTSHVDVTRGGILGRRPGLGEKRAADLAFTEALGMN